MSLTTNDILSKEFSKKFRGYDEDEVNDFLDMIVANLEKLEEENNLMKVRLNEQQDKLKYFEQLQDSLNSSILVANEAAERLKQNARKEAELILYEAELEKEKIIKSSYTDSSKLSSENEALRVEGRRLRESIQQMAQAQIDALNRADFVSMLEPKVTVTEPELTLDESIFEDQSSKKVEAKTTSFVDAESNTEFIHNGNSEPVNTTIPELEALSVTELDNILSELDFSEVDDLGRTQSIDSILGQTIRIELPKDI